MHIVGLDLLLLKQGMVLLCTENVATGSNNALAQRIEPINCCYEINHWERPALQVWVRR